MATKKSEETVTVKSADLEGEAVRSLSVEQVRSLKTSQLGKLAPEQIILLTPEQLSTLSGEQLAALSPEAQRSLPADQQARIVREKAAEQLNPQEVDLAPGYHEDASPNQPLREKIPHYAPGAIPQTGASRYAPPVGQ